ncbi:unnamed protein product [Parajaminaea phylloscopi]
MSSLLQSVLSSKLASASLEEGSAGSASQGGGPDSLHLDDWEEVHTSDEELVGIATAPHSVPGTPANISRPTSPGGDPNAASKTRSYPSAERPVRVKAPKSKTDPLRSLPKEVSQRIFLSLRVRDLLALSLVCRRYRRSATLNYCWYRQCLAQFDSEDAGANSAAVAGLGSASSSSTPAAAGAHWTRRESKMDWKAEYGRRRRQEEKDRLRGESLPGSGTATPSRSQRLADSGVKTARDTREEQWQAEAQTEANYTKNELRAFYKEAGGSKGGKAKGVKAKSGKGQSRAGDDALWE